MTPELTYHAVYLRMLCEVLRERADIDVPALLAASGLSEAELKQGTHRVEAERVAAFMQQVLQICDDPLLGLKWGQRCRPHLHGILSTVLLSSPDFQRMLDGAMRFAALRSTTPRFALHQQGGQAWLDYRDLLPSGRLSDIQCLGVATMCIQLFQTLLEEEIGRFRVILPGPRPAWAEQAAAYFPCALEFGAAQLRFAFPAELLGRVNVNADPQTYAVAWRQAELEAEQLNRSVVARLHVLLAMHEGSLPSLAQAARALHLSTRSLSRALQAEGASFTNLCNGVRAERARSLLRETQLPVEQIGYQLGYTDPSNFIRAFRRWFGCTPQQLRADAPPD